MRDGKKRYLRIALNLGILLCAAVLVFSAVQLVLIGLGYGKAGGEYQALRQEYAPPAHNPKGAQPALQQQLVQQAVSLSERNPDYAGWLELPSLGISYPVVQGEDNHRYLNTTFEGESNTAGSIFMDAGCTEGFGGRHAILYGHNMKDGSMFGPLTGLPGTDFAQQPVFINITAPNGQQFTYQVFYAAATTDTDPIYAPGPCG